MGVYQRNGHLSPVKDRAEAQKELKQLMELWENKKGVK